MKQSGPWGQSPWPVSGVGQRRKKSRLPTVIIIVAIFIVAGPVISSILSSISEPPAQPIPPEYTPGASEPAPTFTPEPTVNTQSTSASQPTPAPQPQETLGPVPTPEDTPEPEPSSTPTPNDQYTAGPPDLDPGFAPYPTTDAERDEALYSNPLYSQTLSPTDCETTGIDLVNTPPADTEAYLNDFVNCLMRAWYAPVVHAGFWLPHPPVIVYTQDINTPCGQISAMYSAVYCGANQQIYYGYNFIQLFPPSMQNMRFFAESIVAHEFGHTVQYRTTIMGAEEYQEYAAATEAEALEWNRRFELQADCFAGSFLNSVAASANLTSSDEDSVIYLFSIGGATPYDSDHGTGANRAYWLEEGLHDWNVGACNTFVVPSDQVS